MMSLPILMGILATYDTAACAEDCDTDNQVPVVEFEECADSMTELKSQIDLILMARPNPADPTEPIAYPTDITDLAAWNAVIDNTADDKIRKCIVIGDMPKPEGTTRTVSKGRTKKGYKLYTVNATVDDVNDANYAATRLLECNPTLFIWPVIRGGKIIAPQKGIRCSVSDAGAEFGRGEDTYLNFDWQFQWEAKGLPAWSDSPFG